MDGRKGDGGRVGPGDKGHTHHWGTDSGGGRCGSLRATGTHSDLGSLQQLVGSSLCCPKTYKHQLVYTVRDLQVEHSG